MKLILSSRDFLNVNSRNVIINNIGKELSDCKVLFIPNEKATKDLIASDKYYNRLYKDGFTNKDNIYIYDECKTEEFRNLDLDIIYIGGGNTFATLNKIKKNNFIDEIRRYIEKGVIYIGGSCGAHIACKNIKHVLNFDNNDINILDYDAIGFFDGIIIPHYDISRKEVYDKLLKEKKQNVYALTNNDSIVVTNDCIEVIYGDIIES